jgi:hypothetical protein
MNYCNLGKLDVDLDLESLKGTLVKQYPGETPSMSLRYYHINNYNIVYEKLPMFFKLSPYMMLIAEINGPGFLGAHRDHGVMCVLNWYKNSNDDKTLFYKEKPEAEPFIADGEKVANIYKLSEVDLVEEFVAKDNEMYLLNVSEIHSVDSYNCGVRRFISLAWSKDDYETILERIKATFTAI